MSKSSGDDRRFNPGRRALLAGLAASASGAAIVSGCGDSSAVDSTGTSPNAGLPDPATSGIDHVVVVMMENRSFDHYYGWLPGADGVQAGQSFADTAGNTQVSHHLTDFQNCANADPDHSYEGGRKQFNNGAMNGFLKTQSAGDTFPIGYYTEQDLPFHGPAAHNWTVCDRYFCSILAETFPNRFYMHSGMTPKLHNSDGPGTPVLPTIWGALKDQGLSGRYYYSDLPFTAEYGTALLDVSFPFASFLLDAAAGTLPQVSYVDPAFLGESPQGISRDDHPLADIRNGQAFLDQVYNAVRSSPLWSKTLLVINYDEWGGFADHVVPDFAPITPEEKAIGNDGRLGFRVPAVIIGPRARRGHVEHTPFDHTSILNLMVWRWGLTPWYPRAATSNNLAKALNFDSPPDTTAAAFNVPVGPFGQACQLAALLPAGASLAQVDAVSRSRAAHILEMQMLKAKAQRFGFPVF